MAHRLLGDSRITELFLQKAVRAGLKHDLPAVIDMGSRYLANMYSNINYDKKGFREYYNLTTKYLEVRYAIDWLADAVMHIIFLRNDKKEGKQLALEVCDRAIEYGEKRFATLDHLRVQFYLRFIRLNKLLLQNNYRAVIDYCIESIRFFNDKGEVPSRILSAFEANAALGYIHLEDYDNGIVFVQELINRSPPESYNHLKGYEIILLLSFRTGRYQEAQNWYIDASSLPTLKELHSYYRETFDIFRGYIHILAKMGYLETSDSIGSFRLAKFMNSFDHASKEKANRNVHLLIIQVLDNLIQRKYSRLSESIEAIEKYVYRHLKSNATKRSQLFIKMLLILPKYAFHRAAVERNAEKYFKSLQRIPMVESPNSIDAEIVPYEELWRMVINILPTKRVYG